MSGTGGPGGLAAAAVLVLGVRLVEALLPADGTRGAGGAPRPADDPTEVRDRLVRAVALTGVTFAAALAGRAVTRVLRRG